MIPTLAPPKLATQADLTVLARPTRLQILRLLAERPGTLTVQGLHAALHTDYGLPTLCYHLRKLRQAGLISLAGAADQAYREHYYQVCWRAFDGPRNALANLLSLCPTLSADYQRHEEPKCDPELWSLLFFKPLRLELLQMIGAHQGRLSVSDLAQKLAPWSLSTVSQQALWLYGASLLAYRDADHYRYYQADGARLAALLHDFDLFRALERRTA